MPRRMAVMMVLNEVSPTSMNGGGAKVRSVKRSKPEFLLVSDNRKDCKKVMGAFCECFSSNQ